VCKDNDSLYFSFYHNGKTFNFIKVSSLHETAQKIRVQFKTSCSSVFTKKTLPLPVNNEMYVPHKKTPFFSDKNLFTTAPGNVQRMSFHSADAIHLEICGRYGR
jgi:hypothetical protein